MSHSLSLDKRIQAFIELGKIMGRAAESIITRTPGFIADFPDFSEALQTASFYNPWFTQENISFALIAWKDALNPESLTRWINPYDRDIQLVNPKRIAVIMAGNIPLVGFHDFLCVLLSGHYIIGKLSSEDKILLPAIAKVLCQIEPMFIERIQFSESVLRDFDAIVATGSNNTARYFEYYFTKYPHIIRKNRNGIAVLSGDESDEAHERLGFDICMYFGLGCRNVSKIFIPTGYDPKKLFKAIEPFIKVLSDHHKYMNNYSYNSSIYLLNQTPYLDNGVMILTESEQYSSPISVLFYEFYENPETLQKKLYNNHELIQCIVTDMFKSENTVSLGNTQHPGLADYADGIDTIKFLTEL